eukprot:2211814-Pleurochrysis_carterae.AAC.3
MALATTQPSLISLGAEGWWGADVLLLPCCTPQTETSSHPQVLVKPSGSKVGPDLLQNAAEK